MSQVYLCIEPECGSQSRIILDLKVVVNKDGDHYHHDCRNSNDLQKDLLQSYPDFLETYNLDII